MATYTFGSPLLSGSGSHESDFPNFIELVKGRSIVSLADGGDFLELGLSGNIMVHISKGLLSGGLEVNCFSTRNPDEPQAFALSLGTMPQVIPAWQLETKLRGLRTAFGLFLLANSEDKQLVGYLRQHPFADIDRLLGDEALEIESLSYGSLVAVVRSKAKQAMDAIVAVATTFVPRARNAFLKKLEADAELRAIEAKRGAVALKRDEFELSKARAEHVVDLVNRAGDRETQAILQNRLRQAVYELASGDDDEREIRGNARRLLSGKQRGNNE
jgi:hypothetical protein